MIRLINSVRNSLFARNVAILISGTAISQAIIVLTSPVLSRIYEPAAFGILAVIFSVSAPFIEVASLKYEVAIVQAREEKDAANLVVLSGGIVTAIALLIAAVIAVSGDWIAEKSGNSAAAGLLLVAPALVFCTGWSNVLVSWLNRGRSYVRISASEVCRSVFVIVLQIGWGLYENAARGLALGRLGGLILGLSLFCHQVGRQQWAFIVRSFNGRTIRNLAREYRQYPTYDVPREFLISFSASIIPILLAMYFDAASAGLYWFAVRILEAPKTLIGKSVRRVFFRKAVALEQNNEFLLPALIKVTAGLFGLGLIPAAAIILFGPGLFDLVFGSGWREAGVYAQYLILWWLSSFCASAANSLVPILRLQRVTLLLEMFGVGLRLAGLAVGIILGSDILAIALCSIAAFLVNTGRIVQIFYHVIKRAPTRMVAETQ